MNAALIEPRRAISPSAVGWEMTRSEARRFTTAYVRYAKWVALAREQLPVTFLNSLRTMRRLRKSVAAFKRMTNILNAAKESRGIPDEIRVEARLDMTPPAWAVEGSVR